MKIKFISFACGEHAFIKITNVKALTEMSGTLNWNTNDH